jgi:hypothetical protein
MKSDEHTISLAYALTFLWTYSGLYCAPISSSGTTGNVATVPTLSIVDELMAIPCWLYATLLEVLCIVKHRKQERCVVSQQRVGDEMRVRWFAWLQKRFYASQTRQTQPRTTNNNKQGYVQCIQLCFANGHAVTIPDEQCLDSSARRLVDKQVVRSGCRL